MKPYILDLCEEGCPMALLRAKRAGQMLNDRTLIIQIRETSSMKDIIRYFTNKAYSVRVETTEPFYVLTIDNKSI